MHVVCVAMWLNVAASNQCLLSILG